MAARSDRTCSRYRLLPSVGHFGGALIACAALLVACADSLTPTRQGCAPPGSFPLVHLGLEGESITALSETPWGLFAGTASSGVHRCGSETSYRWESLGLDHAVISEIVYVPGVQPRVLVAVKYREGATTAAAVFASEDRGQTWAPWDGGLAATYSGNQWAHSLAVDDNDPRRLFMGQSISMLRSLDGGNSWEYVVGGPDLRGMGLDAIAVRAEHVYAGGTTAFFRPLVLRSSDGGATWEAVFPLRDVEGSVHSLAIDPELPSRVVLGMYGTIMRSDDHGETWQRVFDSRDFLVSSLLRYRGWLYAVGATFSEEFSSVPVLTVYRSTDGGDTWNKIDVAPHAGGSEAAALDGLGRLLIGTTGRSRGGVWRFDPTFAAGTGVSAR